MLTLVTLILMVLVAGPQIPQFQDFVCLAICHHMLSSIKISAPVHKYLIKVNVSTLIVRGQTINVLKTLVQKFIIHLSVLNKDNAIGISIKINVIPYQYL